MQVEFKLNGKQVSCYIDNPKELLVDTIRNTFKLTGTKKSCGTGDCGTCTVLVDGSAIRSCLYLTCMAAGKDVITIEGVAPGDDELHPIQQAFIDAGAIQCGYCTPGMVLTTYALLQENSNPTIEEVKTALSGNLCRCTGYIKIFEAVLFAANKMKNDNQ